MTLHNADVWFSEDLPTLTAIVSYFEEHPFEPSQLTSQIAKTQGLDWNAMRRSLARLAFEQPSYFTRADDGDGDGGIQLIGRPTGHALRTVGLWPDAETLADRFIEALNSIDDRDEPERKSKIARIRDAVSVPAATSLWMSLLPT